MCEHRSLGTGIVVYGPATGISIIREWNETRPNLFELVQVDTRSSKFEKLLRESGNAELEIADHHRFRLGDQWFDSPEYFVAAFE